MEKQAQNSVEAHNFWQHTTANRTSVNADTYTMARAAAIMPA